MADTRFSWNRVDKLSGAKELQRRGQKLEGCKRKLVKDSPLVCWAPDCRKRPKAGDWVYYPAAGLATTNKIIGHVDCIDRMVAESRRDAYAQTIGTNMERVTALPPVKQPPAKAVTRELVRGAGVPGASVPALNGAEALTQLAKIRQEIYEEGFRAGVAAALAELQGNSGKAGFVK